jgi:hypothetical protein
MSSMPTAAVVCFVLTCGTVAAFAGEATTAIVDVRVNVVRSCSVDSGPAQRRGPLTISCSSQTGATPQISVMPAPAVTRETTWTTGGAPSDTGVARSRDGAPASARTPSVWPTAVISVDDGAGAIRVTINL